MSGTLHVGNRLITVDQIVLNSGPLYSDFNSSSSLAVIIQKERSTSETGVMLPS